MTGLPRSLGGGECVGALVKAGFYSKRQRGSPYGTALRIFFCPAVVPDCRDPDLGTLRAVIRHSELSGAVFTRLL